MNDDAMAAIEWTRRQLAGSARISDKPAAHRGGRRPPLCTCERLLARRGGGVFARRARRLAQPDDDGRRHHVLRSHAPAGSVPHDRDGQDRGLRSRRRCRDPAHAATALDSGDRRGRPAARPQSGRLLCALRRRPAHAHLCACALERGDRRAKNPQRRPAAVPRRAAGRGRSINLGVTSARASSVLHRYLGSV